MISVDADKCIGCGLCVNTAPNTFKLNDEAKSEVVSQDGDNMDMVKKAAEECPTQAISVE
jgi:ferredoxin